MAIAKWAYRLVVVACILGGLVLFAADEAKTGTLVIFAAVILGVIVAGFRSVSSSR